MRPFARRLYLAATRPWIRWPSVIAITAATALTYARSTFALSSTLQPMGDFDAYFRAARDLSTNIDPYLRYAHDRPFSISLGYIYPPFLARVIQPMAALTLDQIHLVAVIVLQLAVVATVLLTWRLLDLRSWTARLLILDVFLLSSNLIANLEFGNLNVVLMPLSLAWVLAYRRSASWGWIVIGLNVGLKMQQAPLFGLALLRRDARGIVFGGVAFIATCLIGGLTLTIHFFTTVAPKLTNTVPIGAQNTALLADIERLLHPGADGLTYDPIYPEARFILLPIIAIVLILTARALWGLTDRYLEALVALTAAPLLSNYLGASHLLLLAPVGILLADRAIHARAWFALAVLIIAIISIGMAIYTGTPGGSGKTLGRAIYEGGPGLAALCMWFVALNLARARYASPRPRARRSPPPEA